MRRSLRRSIPRPLVGAGVALAIASGCATIMSGGPDRVPITTNPPGATVFVDDVPVAQTPALVALDRRGDGEIRLELPGFLPVVLVRSKTINGWFWVNFCLGFVGIIIDAATGNIQAFDDAPIAIGMTPVYDPNALRAPGANPPASATPSGGYPLPLPPPPAGDPSPH
jgi:hypothetical protein